MFKKIISLIFFNIISWFTSYYLAYVILYGLSVFAMSQFMPLTQIQLTFVIVMIGFFQGIGSIQGILLKLVLRQEHEIMWDKSTQPNNLTSDKASSWLLSITKVIGTTLLFAALFVMSFII